MATFLRIIKVQNHCGGGFYGIHSRWQKVLDRNFSCQFDQCSSLAIDLLCFSTGILGSPRTEYVKGIPCSPPLQGIPFQVLSRSIASKYNFYCLPQNFQI